MFGEISCYRFFVCANSFKFLKRTVAFSVVFFTFYFSFSENSFSKFDNYSIMQDPVILGINCGGGEFRYDEQVFIADRYSTGNGNPFVNRNINDIFNTTQDDIFFSERSANANLGAFGYAIPITNGTYTVKLHFAEIFFGATGGGPGGNEKRVFSVEAEGDNVLSNYDIYREVGAMTAVTKTYTVTVNDELLNLDFSASINQPKISAIEILGNGQILDPDFECKWNDLASSSLEKVEAQSAKVNGKLYVFAGFVANLKVTGATEIYDPEQDNWTRGRDMPKPVTHMGITVVGDEVWILGGFAGNNPGVAIDDVQIYNTITNQWRSGVSLPNRRGSGAAVYNNGKLHFFGGLLPDRKTDVGEHIVLDINNQSQGWKNLATMPNPRNHLSGASVLGKIYAIGGQFGHDDGTEDQKLLHMYDPDTDRWTKKANLLNDRSHFEPGTEVYEDKIIIVGGRKQNFFYDLITEYNPLTNTWTELCPLEDRLLAPVAKVFDNKLLITNGGKNGTCCPSRETKWLDLKPFVLSANSVEPIINTIKIYPNAATTHVNFAANNSIKRINIEIYSITGKLIKLLSNFNINQQLSVNNFSKGLYLVKISSNNNEGSSIQKLIIK